MPNYCGFACRVKGKQKNIKEFVEVMTKDEPPHFYRVLDIKVTEDLYKTNTPECMVYEISGVCAYSVMMCMLDHYDTYAYEVRQKYGEITTSLMNESKRLELEIEIFSSENTIGFEEHYHYDKGVELVDETLETFLYCYDASYPALENALKECKNENEKQAVFVKWVEDNNLPMEMTLKDINDSHIYAIGGFGRDAEGNYEFAF